MISEKLSTWLSIISSGGLKFWKEIATRITKRISTFSSQQIYAIVRVGYKNFGSSCNLFWILAFMIIDAKSFYG